MATQLKVMSFNMRVDVTCDGANQFIHRKDRIAETINSTKPDLIGFQEITPLMREWLVETFPDYYMVGTGRQADYLGETALIAFRKDTMALMSCDTIMLSSSPSIFGSRYDGSDQSGCPRVYVKARLKHRKLAEPFWFYNVHTDHEGCIARMLASTQLLQDITSHNEKFFLTGDFNALPDAPEINMITNCKARKIIDATKDLGGTFHAFGHIPPEEMVRIDYVFADASVNVLESVRIDDQPKDGETYISDHNPIYIVAEL